MTTFAAESQRIFPYSTQCEYDVHICYNGPEIQDTFIGHLKHAFFERGMKTTLDDHWDTRGEEISQTTLRAIEASRCSLVVFGEHFALNIGCLDEVVKVLECQQKGQLFRAIYFRIDRSEVKIPGGIYEVAMARHRENFKNEKIKVLRWEVALDDATKLPGWTYKHGCQCKFIQEIVEDICGELNHVKHKEEAQCNVVCRNLTTAAQLKPFFTRSSWKESENHGGFIMGQPSTSTGSMWKDMMPCSGQLNVLYSEGNVMKKRKWLLDGAQFNVEHNARNKQTCAGIKFYQLLESSTSQEDGLISRELKGRNVGSLNDASVEASSAFLTAENPSLSAVQDTGSVAMRTSEDVKSAVQLLRPFFSKNF